MLEMFSGGPALSVTSACARARAREEVGDYAGACALLEQWWQLGQEPRAKGLDNRAAAELWLRAGTLTGWLGGAESPGTHNKKAQSWISKGLALFELVGDEKGVTECHLELGQCYYREGALDSATEYYQAALNYLQQSGHQELCIVALVRLAVVEQVSSRLREAKALLEQAARMLRPEHSAFLQGRFFNNYALTLKELGKAENNPQLLKEASAYFAQASHSFERAGSLSSCALVLNNLGMLQADLDQVIEAKQHFDRARQLFVELQDALGLAHINESRARLLLKFNRLEEGSVAIAEAVRIFRENREEAFLAEALTTQGTIFARLNRWVEARYAFNEALHVAERCADYEGAGRAALALVEEMCEHLAANERREFFARATHLLAATQSYETRERLEACARRVAAEEEEERKRREQEIQSEKMAALGQLAFGVAHDFNNALTIIKGRAQLMQRLGLAEDAEKSLKLIVEAVDDSASMIGRIKNFGRPRSASAFARVDVTRTLNSVVEMAQPHCKEHYIALRWSPVAPLWVMGDETELKEVFVNLIYNAVDAIGAGGAITIAAQEKGGKLELSVQDTGKGISAEVRSRIFEPFFTTKGERGTGLGLATCYGIIRRHDGQIEVESALGQGATFKITLPLAPEETLPPPPETPFLTMTTTTQVVETSLAF